MKAAVLFPVVALMISGCPIGLTAGAGWSDFTGSGVRSASTLSGERVGGLLVLGSQKVAFMGEALYVRKGAEDVLLTGMATPAEIELQYTQLTYMVRLGMGKHMSFFTGPYTAFIVDANTTAPIPGVGSSNIEGSVADVDTGWVVGVGLKMAMFILDLRYEFGFDSVFDSPGSPVAENSSFAVNLSLKF
jgi:hypothetical protein